jgi:PAS domain-containing protein
MNEQPERQTRDSRGLMAGVFEAPCCLHHAALEALTVPVVVHDDELVLYANAQARRLFAASEPSHIDNKHLELFVHPDSEHSAADQRRLAMEHYTGLRGVHLKARAMDGRVLYSVVDMEPIRFGETSQAALVQMSRYVDGDSFVTYTPSKSVDRNCDDDETCRCLHHAAFHALPVPVIIQDSAQIVDGNRHSRMILSGGRPLAGTPLSDVMHPDFADAARERRSVLIEHRHEYRGLSAKLTTLDGATVYIMVDGAPIDFDARTLGVLVARDLRMA